MILIEQIHSNGRKRRCDARCYRGKKTRCRCICGGKNHGVGHAQALENTREICKDLLDEKERQENAGSIEIHFHDDVLQRELLRRTYLEKHPDC